VGHALNVGPCSLMTRMGTSAGSVLPKMSHPESCDSAMFSYTQAPQPVSFDPQSVTKFSMR
jgi:hypothetical protein